MILPPESKLALVITTMAGLLTALSGMYFASDLSERFDNETQRLSELLRLVSDPNENGNRQEITP